MGLFYIMTAAGWLQIKRGNFDWRKTNGIVYLCLCFSTENIQNISFLTQLENVTKFKHYYMHIVIVFIRFFSIQQHLLKMNPFKAHIKSV